MKEYIKVFKQAIPTGVCSNVIKELEESNNWERHFYHYNDTGETFSSKTDFLMTNIPIPSQGLLDDVTEKCIIEYVSSLPNQEKFTPTVHSNLRFNKYSENTHMNSHIDHIHTLFDSNQSGIPILTVLHHYNDNYTGGDFFIRNERVELGVGDIIMFPSNFMFPHSVSTIQSGDRYTAVSWVV